MRLIIAGLELYLALIAWVVSEFKEYVDPTLRAPQAHPDFENYDVVLSDLIENPDHLFKKIDGRWTIARKGIEHSGCRARQLSGLPGLISELISQRGTRQFLTASAQWRVLCA
jgi:hypothetical protein